MDGAAPLPVPLHTLLGGKYRLDRLLGTGGFGAVYQATQVDLARQVAVKVLHAWAPVAASNLPSSLSRFQREARATGSLGHPHIVQVTDFQHGPPPFLVMEYLRGRSLAQALRSVERFEPTRAVRIALQTLSALDATHRIDIVHRDIKPANLFLVETATDEDFVKVLDFGIAKDLSGAGTLATESGAVLGTLGYMAPEQALGLAVDERADIYAVGGLLYRMLTGVTPTQAANVGDLMRVLAHGTIVPLEQRAAGLPPQLVDVVTRSLAHDPEARPRDASSFALELAAAIGLRPPPWATPRANVVVSGAGANTSFVSPEGRTHVAGPSVTPPATAPSAPVRAQSVRRAPSAGKGIAIVAGSVVAGGLFMGVGIFALAATRHPHVGPDAAGAVTTASVVTSNSSAASPSEPTRAAPSATIAPRTTASTARRAAPVEGVLDKNGKCKCMVRVTGRPLCEGNVNERTLGICLFTGPPGAPCHGFDYFTGAARTGTLECP